MVRGAIGTGEAGAIEQERDRQVLQSDFLEQLIEAALQERAVDIDDRPHAGFGLAGGEGDGVRFANADIEKPLRESVADGFELIALAHRGGEDRDARVILHLLIHGLAGDIGVSLGGAGFDTDDFFFVALEGGGRVEENGIGGGGLEAVAFFSKDVEQHRAVDVFDHFQVAAERGNVVAIDGADVAEAEFFEQHAAVQARP